MAPYIRNYIDCLTGKIITDEGNKAHFRKALQLEVDKTTPLIKECEEKGIDLQSLSPSTWNNYHEMLNALNS